MPVMRKKNGGQDAINLLKQDHEKVQELLQKLEAAKDQNAQRNIFAQIDSALQMHTRIEEEIFYPAFRTALKNSAAAQLYFEAVEEHHTVDLVLPEMRTTKLSRELFSAKAKVLKDLIEHHVGEEETQMFPKARKALGSERLRELGMKMQRRKDQIAVGMWDQSLEVINPFAARSFKTSSQRRSGGTASKRRAA